MGQFRIKVSIGSLILALGISISFSLQGQKNCICPVGDKQKIDRWMESNDSIPLFQTIRMLQDNRSEPCLLLAFNYEIKFRLNNHNRAISDSLLQKQAKGIAARACKNDWQKAHWLNKAENAKSSDDYENLSSAAFKALELAENDRDELTELKAIQYTVHLFTRLDEDEKNWAYIKRAEKIIQNLEADYSTASFYNWLAFEYENKYTLTQRPTLLDSALMFAEKAQYLAKSWENFRQMTQSFRVYEAVSYHRSDLRKALSYTDSALFYAKKIKLQVNLSSLYLSKAWDHLDLGEHNEAIRWQDSSIAHAEKYTPGQAGTMKVYIESARIFEQAGDPVKALAVMKKYDRLKDSIFNIERSEKINLLEQQYQKAKNERTIRELAQQKRIYLLLALAGFLAIILIGFWVRQNTLTHRQKILEAEQRLNRARMNPHFFFNALASIQSYALREKDGKSVASLIAKFAHIMRETLESTYNEFNTVEEEIEFLDQYLTIQQLRFPGKFNFEIVTGNALETKEAKIPSMIIQPFVENSIEHGFKDLERTGNVKIYFTQIKNEMVIEIEDNGTGLKEQTAKTHASHISRAHQIIRDRLYLLNSKLNTKANFTLQKRPDTGNGVLVKIQLPLIL